MTDMARSGTNGKDSSKYINPTVYRGVEVFFTLQLGPVHTLS